MEDNKKVIEEDFQKDQKEPMDNKPSYKELEQSLKETKKAVSLAHDTIKKQIDEVKEANDKYLRALADYQNLQRNSAITISKSKDAGKVSVFKELIPIMDNFEKAIEANEVSDGVKLIYNGLKSIFSSNGVEVINPNEGDKFDDSVHEAIVALNGGEEDKNTIGYVQFKGYKMGDTILRYAKVGVYV